MRLSHSLWLALPIIGLHASVAEAAETGDMSGRVTSEAGDPIAGATITVSGPRISGVRTATTNADGSFRFLGLPVGAHEVMIEAPEYGPVRMMVTVRLDQTVRVPATLSQDEIQEVVVVEAEEPVIDTSKSSISTEMTDESLQNLPVGRSYQSAVRMLPGIYGRVDTISGDPGASNPSVRGEGAYGNNYYVDGISTRDPATKTFGSDVQFDSIEAVQVYTDGAPAEFGQATGMMVNVITKDGGDEHHGTAAYYFSSHASGGTYPILDIGEAEEVETRKRKFVNHEVALTAGGPIIKEKLWYYAALQGNAGWTYFEGQPYTTEPRLPQGLDGFGKITWFATPDLTFQYQINGQGTQIKNQIASAQRAADAQEQYRSFGISHILTTTWRPSPSGELQFKASYLPININVVPQVGDKATPQIQNVNTGEIFNNASAFDLNTRSRLGAQIDYTQLAEAGGSHRIKVGAQYWSLREARDLVYTGGSGTVPGPFFYEGEDQFDDGYAFDGIKYFTDPSRDLNCEDTADGGVRDDCWGFTTYQNVGELGHRGQIAGGFIQDDYQPIDSLTINAGVRLDTETLYQNAGDKILSSFMPAPRLGVAWDVTNDSKTLVSANFGRYYDLHGNGFASWGDTRNSNVFGSFQRDFDDVDGDGNTDEYFATNIQDPAANPLVYCTEDSLADHVVHLVDDLGFSQEAAEAEREIAESYCDGKLRPYHMDKLAVAVEREVIDGVAIGVKGIWSQTVNLPEDIDINLDTWVIANDRDAKRRDYRALEFTLKKKPTDNWSALVSYTLSESTGHMPGQFELSSGGSTGSNGNNVGVYLDNIDNKEARAFFYDNGLGWLPDQLAGLGTTYDDEGYYGYLPYHSFHQVKVNGFYTFDFGTTLGVVYEYNSGRAWQKRGMVPLYGDFFAFPEGRGSRFMPAVHYIDFRVGHRLEIAENQTVELNLDLFNLPDLAQSVTYYENDNASFGKTLFRQAPRSLRIGAKYTF